MTFTVVVTDGVSDLGLAPLTDDEQFVVERIDDSASAEFDKALRVANGLIVRSATKVDAEMIGRARALRVIGRAGVGIDNIDLDAATDRGVAVFNAPGGNTVAAAELTMALMLSLVRRVTAADRSVRKTTWDRARFHGVELQGKTLGLLGAGRIGGEVAKRCQVFGMDVIVYDPYLSPARAGDLGVQLVELEDVIDKADVISLHVPLTEETRGMVGADSLRRMKDRAFLINASRGGVIDEEALAAALHEGQIAGAALDVYDIEPLPANSPLRDAPNLVLTPHLGAATEEAQVGTAREVSDAIRLALLENDISPALNAGDLR